MATSVILMNFSKDESLMTQHHMRMNLKGYRFLENLIHIFEIYFDTNEPH